MKIENTKVFGLENAIRCSKFPMSVNVDDLNFDITDRVKSLGSSKGSSGHDQFLTGIIVQFDLTFSIKAWTEAERYHFFDFISSQSTMHKISKFDIKSQCNQYVTENTINELDRLKNIYLETEDKEDYLKLLYNIPTGFELTAGMTTNYRQLKTIYGQRRTHRLPDWQMFCDWEEELPMFNVMCLGQRKESD